MGRALSLVPSLGLGYDLVNVSRSAVSEGAMVGFLRLAGE